MIIKQYNMSNNINPTMSYNKPISAKKRTILIVIAAAVILFMGIFALVFSLTGGLVDSYDQLISKVQSDDISGAYELLSEEYKNNNSVEQFESDVAALGLGKTVKASWNNREISNNRGVLSGTLTMESGGIIPMTITFVKENDQWKIYSLDKLISSELFNEDSDGRSQHDNETLVFDTLNIFAAALRNNDINSFYEKYTSSALKAETSSADFADYFSSFLSDPDAYLSPAINNGDIKMTAGLEGGKLSLVGSIADEFAVVEFDFEYMQEDGEWKLNYFEVRAKSK